METYKEITTAKKKLYKDMTEAEKQAFVEAVCIRAMETVLKSTSGSSTRNFFKYWATEILKVKPSNAKYLDNYFYEVRNHVCVLCISAKDGLIDVSRNYKELKVFVYNVVNDIPARSPILDAVNSGKTKLDLQISGIDIKEYGLITQVPGAKPRKDSLRQRILRGEITRWEAYEKPAKERKKKLTEEKNN